MGAAHRRRAHRAARGPARRRPNRFSSRFRNVRASSTSRRAAGRSAASTKDASCQGRSNSRANAARNGQRAALEAGTEFPAFVRVDRSVQSRPRLDRRQHGHANRATARRLVGGDSARARRVGADRGVKVRDGVALVGLGAGESRAEWHSGLARAETIELSVPADAARSEVWTFVVNPQWNVAFEGFPPVLPESVDESMWMFRFMPRPGEKLSLTVTRPKAARARRWPSIRCAAGDGRQALVGHEAAVRLPQHAGRSPRDPAARQARVTAVSFDGSPEQLRPEKVSCRWRWRRASHSVDWYWEKSRDVGFRTTPRRRRPAVAGQQHPTSASRAAIRAGRCSPSGGASDPRCSTGASSWCSSGWPGCSDAGRGRRCASPSGCCSVSGFRRNRGSCSR